MNGINNIQAEGQLYDILAPEVVNDYIEKLGKPCANPNGYTTGSLILATDGGNVQRLYKVTQAINSSQNIVEDGNVVRKKLGDLFDDLEVALDGEIDDVDTELGNVKQALSNGLGGYIDKCGVKNLSSYVGTFVGRTYATNANEYKFGSLYLKQGEKIVYTCNQDSALVSNTRNTLVIAPPNTAPSQYIYEDGNAGGTTNHHLEAGLHIIEYTATSDGEYNFYFWPHTLSSAVTYSKFMICTADAYAYDSSYVQPATKNIDALSYKDNGVLGAKNWFDLKSSNCIAITSGATSTKTSTGINIQSSTATTNIGVQYPINPLKPNTDYILSCNVTVTSGTSRIFLVGSKAGQEDVRILNTGNNISGNVSYDFNSGDYDSIRFVFYCSASTSQTGNVTYDNLMIRLASDADETYRPYVPTNSQLLSYKDNGVLGAHNIMPMSLGDIIAANAGGTWSGNAYTYNGITFTVNTDAKGNITGINVNGTSTANNIPLYLQTSFTLVEGKQYILSGCPSGGSISGYRLTQYGAAFGTFNDTGSGVTFTCSANNTGKMIILISTSGTAVSNKTFYPMVRLATDTDPTYQPYAMTNRELTDARFLNGTLGGINVDNFTSSAEFTIPSDNWYHLYLQTNVATSSGGLSIMLGSDYSGNVVASHRNGGVQYECCDTNLPLKKGTKVIFKCTDTTTQCQYQAIPIT